MSDYSSLKATINANVKANNNHEITGSIMNSVLNAMVNSLGAGYQFIGMATPTNPGSAQTPDYKCFYIATTPGTYTNLGGLVVADGEVAILKYDTSWTKEVTGIATAESVSQLGQNIFDLNDPSTIKEGYELGIEGNYVANESYNSSGDIIIPNLNYITNYTGNIYCYSENGTYLGRVASGNALLTNTHFVRINWLSASSAPVFCSISDKSIVVLMKDNENRIIKYIYDKLYDLNSEDSIREGYELNASGRYVANESYNSSGDMYIKNDSYITNYTGNIYCYSENGTYLGKVASGNALLTNTHFVRINWKKTIQKPEFSSIQSASIQSLIDRLELTINTLGNKVNASIEEQYKLNGDDIVGTELYSNGTIHSNSNYRVSQFVKLEPTKRYICNISGNYYYYDANFNYLGRVNTNAYSIFTNEAVAGAVYMRTNVGVNTPIEIFEVDLNNKKLPQKNIFNGVCKKQSVDYSGNNFELPQDNCMLTVKFTTSKSLYDRTDGNQKLFSIAGDGIIVSRGFNTTQSDSIYCKKSECDIKVLCSNTELGNIPIRLNNYGSDLFSIRLKYPVVTVATDGETTMATPMPSNFENAYISKSDEYFTIYNGDNTIFKRYDLLNYSNVEELVDVLLNDVDLAQDFEIKKFACEGIALSKIDNFEKIYISKQIEEYLYEDTLTPTGNVYYDSYPTIVRSSDIGYEHTLKLGYLKNDNNTFCLYVSFDGMFVRLNDTDKIMISDYKILQFNENFVDEIVSVKVSSYKTERTPMISMLHDVQVSNELVHQDMSLSTFRLDSMLGYLQSKGFTAQNFKEAIESIRGNRSLNAGTYCLTFDDRRYYLWADKTIRNLFNKYNAKPTLVYIFFPEHLESDTPPSTLSKELYWQIKNSGWDIISHGFTIHTDFLSYAQFINGFNKTKERWKEWYNEDIYSYNPHGHEITDYQFYLLKQLGFSNISSGEARLGWFCECGTTIDVEYKRVTWMDSEPNWETLKDNIDKWAE